MYDTLQVKNVLENNIYIYISCIVNMYDTLQVKNVLENKKYIYFFMYRKYVWHSASK